VCAADPLVLVGDISALGGSARRGCGPSAVADFLLRAVGVGSPAGEECSGDGKRRQSVVKGAGTPGCGAEIREGRAAGAGFVDEREGSQTDASEGHELRHWRVVRMLGSRQRCSSEGRA
jgi:hypothetical protein